jgi:hypothetical protein
MSTTKNEMLPIDVEQCQALVPNGNTFMTFGGKPGLVRCKAKPTWIAIEKVVDSKDGERGGMSLCDTCKAVCEKQLPGKCTYQRIGKEAK